MAFKSAKFGSGNPTGDKAFNKITGQVFGPDAQGNSPKTEKPKKPSPKKKNGYDTATNTFRSNDSDGSC